MSLKEAGQEVGYHPFHLGRLVKHSRHFQEFLDVLRAVHEHEYMTSSARLANAAIERRLDKIVLRQRQKQERAREYRRRAADPGPTLSPPSSPPPMGTARPAGVRFAADTPASPVPASSAAPARRYTGKEVAELEQQFVRVQEEITQIKQARADNPWSVEPEREGAQVQDERGTAGRPRRAWR